MDGKLAWQRLPKGTLEQASERGGEFAWRVNDIDHVIEAARERGLVNLGGPLQFRFPNGHTCECYWIEVSTLQAAPPSMKWDERVEESAAKAKEQFHSLIDTIDIVAEGRKAFSDEFDMFAKSGNRDPKDAAYFVWYVLEPGQ